MGEMIVFWIASAVAVTSAIVVIAHRNPVFSVMSLVVTLLSLATLFVMLAGHLLGVLLVAGGIVFVIDRAQGGLYTQLEINRGLPAPYLVRFFEQTEDRWLLREDVRKLFRFFRQNLVEPWSLDAPVDILILRNVLIYFDVDTRREILRRVRSLLRPDGYLLLGSAETTLNIDSLFTRVPIGRTVFYQVTNLR